ncbi:hypothetical protein BBJ28_00005137 [Nothophytophthora sp. Chile5]|nr:hypothetical protein BBJ28_00005137 [Nothophytophthora sp. Chile5]
MKDRDFCYLAATGVVRFPRTGHKLGYRLRHSMTFPSCPPFRNRSVVRGQLFFRQLRNGRVEVFHRGSYDARGGGGTGFGLGLPRSIAEKSMVETSLMTSGRWGHDETPEEDEENKALALSNRHHFIVLFAPDTSSYEVEALVVSSRQRRVLTAAAAIPTVSAGIESSTPSSRLSAKPTSVDSDAVNTVNSSPPDNRRHRSGALAAACNQKSRDRLQLPPSSTHLFGFGAMSAVATEERRRLASRQRAADQPLVSIAMNASHQVRQHLQLEWQERRGPRPDLHSQEAANGCRLHAIPHHDAHDIQRQKIAGHLRGGPAVLPRSKTMKMARMPIGFES